MQRIGMFEMKTHLPKVIRNVEQGQKYIVTNRNKEVAVLMSIQEYRRQVGSQAWDKLREIFKDTGPWSVDEILSIRDEGRR